jgi:hypothetical protein
MDLDVLLRGAAPPIVAVLLLVSLAGSRMLPLAMAIGLYVAYGLLKEWPALPHELWRDPNGVTWLMWGVVASATLAFAQRLRLLPARLVPSAATAVAAMSLWLTLSKVATRWSSVDVALHVGGGSVLVAATMLTVRQVIARRPAVSAQAIAVGLLLVVVLSLDAALLVLGKSAFLGQLCGAVAAALGAAIGTALWRRQFALRAVDGIWIGGAHALFLLAGVHLSYLPWWPAGLALAAPFLLLLVPRRLGQEHPLVWLMIAAPLVLAPIFAALWLAIPEPNPYGY